MTTQEANMKILPKRILSFVFATSIISRKIISLDLLIYSLFI